MSDKEDRTPGDRKRRGGTEQASECPVCGAQARRITEDREATWGGARDGEVGITVTIPDERWECPTCEEEWYDRDQIDRHFSALMKGAIKQLRAENVLLTAELARRVEDDEPSEPDHVALQVLCRVFDDGADVAFPEWRAWYEPAEWFDFSRALGAFIAGRLNDARTDAKPSAWALLNEQGEMFDVKFSEASARAYVRLCADEGGNVSCAPLYLTAVLDRVRDDARITLRQIADFCDGEARAPHSAVYTAVRALEDARNLCLAALNDEPMDAARARPASESPAGEASHG